MRVLGRDVAQPAARVMEEEEADDLEDPLAAPRVDVADVPELLDRRRLDPRLFGNLPKGRRLSGLARADQALRKRPDPFRLAARPDRRDHPCASQATDDHSPR